MITLQSFGWGEESPNTSRFRPLFKLRASVGKASYLLIYDVGAMPDVAQVERRAKAGKRIVLNKNQGNHKVKNARANF